MSKKTLDTSHIQSDLEGSAFFPKPSTIVPQDDSTPVPPYPQEEKPQKRKIKQRHPFDIYQDQLDRLREIAFKEKMEGGIGSMSQMVREAIDSFLSSK